MRRVFGHPTRRRRISGPANKAGSSTGPRPCDATSRKAWTGHVLVGLHRMASSADAQQARTAFGITGLCPRAKAANTPIAASEAMIRRFMARLGWHLPRWSVARLQTRPLEQYSIAAAAKARSRLRTTYGPHRGFAARPRRAAPGQTFVGQVP